MTYMIDGRRISKLERPRLLKLLEATHGEKERAHDQREMAELQRDQAVAELDIVAQERDDAIETVLLREAQQRN